MAFKYYNYRTFMNRRISPTELGQKLGIDEKTVRTRVKKMEDEGFIKYYQAIPNLHLFGINQLGFYCFEAADIRTKHEVVKDFQKSPYVAEVADFLGPTFMALLAGASVGEIQKTANELSEKLDLVETLKLFDRRTTSPTLSPGILDWQILRRLRYDALCSGRDVAKSLSITARMADYRISKLLDSGTFSIQAMINTQRQQGIIFYGLLLYVEEKKRESILQQIRRMYKARLWLLLTPNNRIVSPYLFASAIGEPEETLLSTLRLDGVSRGSYLIFKEWAEARPNWIDGLIEDMIGAREPRPLRADLKTQITPKGGRVSPVL